jgi:hypothetical protein
MISNKLLMTCFFVLVLLSAIFPQTTISFSPEAGSQTFSISSPVSWSVTDNAAWITVSPTSGSGNATVTVSVTTNTSTNSRSAPVIVLAPVQVGGVTDRTVTVTQSGITAILSVSPTDLSIGCSSGSSGTFEINSNISWSVSDDASWLDVSPANGSNNNTVTITSNSANASNSLRSAWVTVAGGGITRTVTVMQNGAEVCDECAGYALEFNGKDNYVDCGNDSSLALEKEFTLCAWIYKQSSSADWERILAKSDDKEYDYWLQLKPWEFSVSGGFTIQEGFYARHLDGIQGTPVPLNEWVQLAVTYDGSRLSGYLNGVLDKSRPVSGMIQKSNKPLWIGRLQNSYNYNGLIDEVAIWSRALSSQEIRENMHCKYPHETANLAAHWHFDEGNGNMVGDQTIHKNHGIIYGAAWRASTVPVSFGKSQTNIVSSTGRVEFNTVNIIMDIVEKSKTDSIVVSMLECKPSGASPAGFAYNDSTQYWIIEKYGNGTLKADVSFYLKKKLPLPHDQKQLQSLVLLTRSSNGDSNWTILAQAAGAANDYITFKNISVLGQFAIGTSLLTFVTDHSADAEKGMDFGLSCNYPNPFNPTTTIEFFLTRSERVNMKVFSISGKQITELVNERLAAGIHKVNWNASNMPSGVYFYMFEVGRYHQLRKAILLK